MAGGNRLVKAASAAIGASTGASAGATVGHPFAGASAGADMGRTAARKYLIPAKDFIGRMLRTAAETGYPEEIYAGVKGMPTMRKGMNVLLDRLIPGVGNALMVADAGRLGYKTGEYGGEKSGLTNEIGRSIAPLFGSSPQNYDAMVEALLAQEAKRK